MSKALKSPRSSKSAPVLERGRRTIIDVESPTVRRIFDAAEEIFAERSFSGTGMEDIAALAGCNKATIYYHIGGKEKLYQEILKRHFTLFAERLEHELADCRDPIAGLRTMIRVHGELFSRNERSTRTIAHEIAAVMNRLFGITVRLLSQGVEAGLLPPLDPVTVHLMFTSPLFISAITPQFTTKIATVDAQAPPLPHPGPADMAAVVERIFLGGLLPSTK